MSAVGIVLAAGGTGGHMFPALALGEELIARGRCVLLFTDDRGQAYAPRVKGIAAHVIPSASPSRGGHWGKASSVVTLARGAWAAQRRLREVGARVVVGFGGYASFPTGFMAARSRRPLLLHEQNAYLGLANRKLARMARAIAVAYPKVAGIPSTNAAIIEVGNPVRPAIIALRERPYVAPAASEPFRVLVTGGSQGARVFSDVLPASFEKLDAALRARLEISQQCRPEDIDSGAAAYEKFGIRATLRSFFDDIPERIANAHLLICRSGASTVAEVTAAGRPAIFIPYPHAADDHQRYNAEQIEAAGAGWVLRQSDFTGEAFATRLVEHAPRPHELARAADAARAIGRPDAARALADLVEQHLPRDIQGKAA